MPRIPIYNSRGPVPGPIPGLGDARAAPGRALARFGAAIGDFGVDLANWNTRQDSAGPIPNAKSEHDTGQPQDETVDAPGPATPEEQEAAIRQARDALAATLDEANDEALVLVMRADAFNEALLDGDYAQLTGRALAYFDAASQQLIEATGDPDQRARRQAMIRQNREVLVQRTEARRDRHSVAILDAKLKDVLNGLAGAALRDPAMLPAMLQKGNDTIAQLAQLAGLGAERAAAMTTAWTQRANIALLEGMIERDPSLALEWLQSGDMDAPLGNDTATIERLARQAEFALAAAEADARQRERTHRRKFELDKAEYLERIRRTGRGDPGTEALAGALLDADEQAAFRDEVAAAEAYYTARARYAFMTAEEIDADIADKAPGGSPQDAVERSRDHQARIAARDEILAERGNDSAGWAMRDETVSLAFAAAEEAAEIAAKSDAGLAEAEQADRLFQRAIALRLLVQAEMGETPRLLSEAERETLAAELQSLPPVDRLARIGELRRRYGAHHAALSRELVGRIAPDTVILMAWAGDPILAGMLARGMEGDGVAFEGARVLTLPVVGGTLDASRLEDKQLYRFMAGGRVVDVVYDRKANALVPAIPDDDGAMQTDGTTVLESIPEDAIKAFSPAPFLDDAAIAKFRGNTGYGLTRGDGGFTLIDPSAHESFPMSEEEAAVLAHIWTPEIARRVEATGALWREDLPPDQKRRRIQAEVYKDIPEALRGVSPSGPNWISMEGGDPEDFGQRLAARRLKAFDAVAVAIESGATEREIAERVSEFQEAMLPEVFGLGRVVKEFFMDVAPGLGNVRSIRHLQNDIAEIQRAVETGEWGDAAIASGMAVLDAIGIFPGLNTVKGVARGVARGIPYADRLLGERSFRRLMRQWSETGKKFTPIDARALVGDLLDGFDKKIQMSFLGLVRNRVGKVGEKLTFEDAIKRMDPNASEQVRVKLPLKKVFPTNTRIFDAEATLPSENLELANATLGRLARWLAGAGDEVIPGTKGASKKLEIKTGKTGESHAQKKFREDVENNPESARNDLGVDGIVNLRNAPSELPIDFLVQDISKYLEGWVSKERISKDVSDKLQLAMRQLKAKGIESIRLEDYVGFLARLNAALLRDGGDLMSDPAGMS